MISNSTHATARHQPCLLIALLAHCQPKTVGAWYGMPCTDLRATCMLAASTMAIETKRDDRPISAFLLECQESRNRTRELVSFEHRYHDD